MTKPTTLHECSICLDYYTGHGHNAEPINHGRCCTSCNDTVVIPIRMIRYYQGQNPREVTPQ